MYYFSFCFSTSGWMLCSSYFPRANYTLTMTKVNGNTIHKSIKRNFKMFSVFSHSKRNIVYCKTLKLSYSIRTWNDNIKKSFRLLKVSREKCTSFQWECGCFYFKKIFWYEILTWIYVFLPNSKQNVHLVLDDNMPFISITLLQAHQIIKSK